MAFTIAWSTDEEQWSRLEQVAQEHPAGSDFDLALQALEELLFGSIQFVRDGKYPKPVPVADPTWEQFSVWAQRGHSGARTPEKTWLYQGFDLSLVDLTYQLANVLGELAFEIAADGAEALYQQTDNPLKLLFRKEGGLVYILAATAEDRSWMLPVPADDFFLGVRLFLTSFSDEVHRRAPQLFTWKTFSPLKPFLTTSKRSL